MRFRFNMIVTSIIGRPDRSEHRGYRLVHASVQPNSSSSRLTGIISYSRATEHIIVSRQSESRQIALTQALVAILGVEVSRRES